VLLSSGVRVTFAHHCFLEGKDGFVFLACGVGLGFYFTLLQGFEYLDASFRISDSAYGRVFFLATGFHGLHVVVGGVFLGVVSVSFYKERLRELSHSSLTFSVWY